MNKPSARRKYKKGVDWDVFYSMGSDDGDMQIQMVDEEAAFSGDDAAVLYVIRRAKAGDKEAIDALWEVLDEDGLVNRILWCQAMGWNGPEDYAWEGE